MKTLSPFRYPGGKSRLAPRIRGWLKKRPALFIEPFCGGASVGLTVAVNNLANHVMLSELDEHVAAVWETILYGDAARLVDRITALDKSPENIRRIIFGEFENTEDRALQMLVINRSTFNGFLSHNKTRGLFPDDRIFYQIKNLEQRILRVWEHRDRITFVHRDAFDVIEQYGSRPDAAWYFDPPYYGYFENRENHSYQVNQLDHRRLFASAQALAGDFLMSYNDVPEVRALAGEHGFEVAAVSTRTKQHRFKQELLIGRDLSWWAQ